jgi:DNA/RNA-binding domain of Phe-tRNA-synthetase-like protein
MVGGLRRLSGTDYPGLVRPDRGGRDPMDFFVEPDVFTRFPGMRLAVVVAHDIDNRPERPEVFAAWADAWAAAVSALAPYGNAQSHPRVVAWRQRFQAIGVSMRHFPTSIEALLRRAMKGGAPFRINPLVDFYNGVSLRHAVPVGGFDLDRVADPLVVRLTRDGDTFAALDSEGSVSVPAGEVAYATGATILTRQLMWRQARDGLIHPETRSVFLVSESLPECGPGLAEVVLDEVGAGLRRSFGATVRDFVVDAATPRVSW